MIWYLVAGLAAVGAALVGLPAWNRYQATRREISNADRYQAWRGRAASGPPATVPVPGQVWAALALLAVAIGCVVIGMSSS